MSAGGDEVAHASVVRREPLADHLVTRTDLRPERGGLYGELYEPTRPPAGKASAVVVWGGSEGGIFPATAETLAAHGHPALALAYFGEPGLPQHLERVPLEYFERALRRLAHAPHVDPARLFVWGTSRGSEPALLTAIANPRLVHGVVALVPTAVDLPGLPDSSQPAWTRGGRPVPTSQMLGSPHATDVTAANIAVSRFPGPILVACAGMDQVWPSCPYAKVLRSEDAGRVSLHEFPDAGFGGTPYDSAAGRAALWPRLLAFLDDPS